MFNFKGRLKIDKEAMAISNYILQLMLHMCKAQESTLLQKTPPSQSKNQFKRF